MDETVRELLAIWTSTNGAAALPLRAVVDEASFAKEH